MKTMKTSNEKKQVCVGLLYRIFVVVHVSAESECTGAGIPQFHRFITTHK